MQGSLTIPRVQVFWGNICLTERFPDKENKEFIGKDIEFPLVYDVKASVDSQGQTPSGSMKINPTGPGYAIYEKLVAEMWDMSITIKFFYIGGREIVFEYYWGGQSETFGTSLEVTIKLVSIFDGLVNGAYFSSVQVNREQQPLDIRSAASELWRIYGLDVNTTFDLFFSVQVREDLKKAKVRVLYNDGATFTDALQQLVKANGNNVFFSNIMTLWGYKNMAYVYTSVLWESRNENFSINIPNSPSLSFSSNHRNGFFLGPSIIQTFTRTSEWQPPQKSQEITAFFQKKVAEKTSQTGRKTSSVEDPYANVPLVGTSASANGAQAPPGVVQGLNAPNNDVINNADGPKKQDLLNLERGTKLTVTVFMCPALVGIRPLDILFIPNLEGNYMEEWVVSSLEYQQNSRGVEIAIQAHRPYGYRKPLIGSREYTKAAQFAIDNLLMGAPKQGLTAELEAWIGYAWVRPLGKNTIDEPTKGRRNPTSERDTDNRGEESTESPERTGPYQPIIESKEAEAPWRYPEGVTVYLINDKGFGQSLANTEALIPINRSNIKQAYVVKKDSYGDLYVRHPVITNDNVILGTKNSYLGPIAKLNNIKEGDYIAFLRYIRVEGGEADVSTFTEESISKDYNFYKYTLELKAPN